MSMTPRGARRMTIAFFAAYTVALTYPGVRFANRIEPYLLGLPFSLAWVVLWVVLSFVVFLVLHRAYARAPATPSGGAPDAALGRASGVGGGEAGGGEPLPRDAWNGP